MRVFVIWLPVIASDTGPPDDEARARVRDPRVIEYWDPQRWASPRMMDRAALIYRSQGREPDWGPGAIAWDIIAGFAPGAVWEDPFPSPVWWINPVENGTEELERQVAALPRAE